MDNKVNNTQSKQPFEYNFETSLSSSSTRALAPNATRTSEIGQRVVKSKSMRDEVYPTYFTASRSASMPTLPVSDEDGLDDEFTKHKMDAIPEVDDEQWTEAELLEQKKFEEEQKARNKSRSDKDISEELQAAESVLARKMAEIHAYNQRHLLRPNKRP